MATGPVNILDLAKTSDVRLDRNVMNLLSLNSSIMQDLKIQVIGTRDMKYTQFVDQYGQPDFSNIGEGFKSVKSVPEQVEATAYPFGMNIDVDRRNANDKAQVSDPRSTQLKANMVGYGAFVSNMVINGDPANPGTAPSGAAAPPFKGVRWYLDNPTSDGGAKLDGSLKIDAGGVDLSTSPTTTVARSFMRILDNAIYRMWRSVGGKGLVAYLPSEIMAALPDIMRAGGAFDTTKDQFGRTFTTYGNVKLVDAGLGNPTRNPLDPNTSAARVIGWENASGVRNDALTAGNRFSSIYIIQHGADAMYAISQEGTKTQDLGLLNDGVTYRTQVSDSLGLVFRTPWAVSRVYDIKVG